MRRVIHVVLKIAFLALLVNSVNSLDYKDVMKIKRNIVTSLLECDLKTKNETRVKAEYISVHAFSTRTNKSHVWNLHEAGSALKHNSNYNPRDKTYIYIPGLQEGIDYVDWDVLKPYFLQINDINFFFIDCTTYTTVPSLNTVKSSLEITRNVYGLGVKIGKFLNKLVNDVGYPLNKIHVFGHSLGYVISARVGKEFELLSGKKLTRITALEPAGLCLDGIDIEDQLTENDATYVDMYHSNAGNWGTDKFHGLVHILMNGGGPVQKDCPKIILASTLCAHQNMLLTFWGESALNPNKYFAVKCDTLEDGRNEKCFGKNTLVGAGTTPQPGFYNLKFSFNFGPQFIPTVTKFFVRAAKGILGFYQPHGK